VLDLQKSNGLCEFRDQESIFLEPNFELCASLASYFGEFYSSNLKQIGRETTLCAHSFCAFDQTGAQTDNAKGG